MKTNVLYWIVVGVCVFVIHGFVLNDLCIGLTSDDSCVCSWPDVYCDFGKPTMPTFKVTRVPSLYFGDTFSFRKRSSKMTSINGRAFCNLSFTSDSKIKLDFAENQLTAISDQAFDCIENNVVILILAMNNLTYVPRAIGNLRNLSEFYFLYNPILTIDSYVFASIGHSLTNLSISLSAFKTWPQEMTSLRKLERLKIIFLPIQSFPDNAFVGMAATLQILHIEVSDIRIISKAICSLTHLTEFVLDVAQHLTFPYIDQCDVPVTSLKSLSIAETTMTSFPNVFNNYPALTYIDLHMNNISAINGSLIPYDNQLDSLFLDLNPIHCSCNTLSPLKTWNISGVQIGGMCEVPNESIKEYFVDKLPRC